MLFSLTSPKAQTQLLEIQTQNLFTDMGAHQISSPNSLGETVGPWPAGLPSWNALQGTHGAWGSEAGHPHGALPASSAPCPSGPSWTLHSTLVVRKKREKGQVGLPRGPLRGTSGFRFLWHPNHVVCLTLCFLQNP